MPMGDKILKNVTHHLRFSWNFHQLFISIRQEEIQIFSLISLRVQELQVAKSLAQNACRASLNKRCRVLCYCKNVFSEEIMVRRTWNYAFLFILRCWIHLTHLQTMKNTLNWSNHTIIKIFQIKLFLD